MNIYATLDDLRKYIEITDTSKTADDPLLIRSARIASTTIDEECGRHFYPLLATQTYDRPHHFELWFDDDVLAVTSITNGDGTSVASTAYVLRPNNYYPKYKLDLLRTSGVVWQISSTGNDAQAISLIATLGYNKNWATAWQTSDAIADAAGINASVTTITVSDADGADENGMTPRFQVGQLIKIESEYLWVIAVTAASTNTLTVRRAMNGTTAASHATGTAIYNYRPMYDIQQATLRLTKWLYNQRDSNGQFDRAMITADGTKILPYAMPDDIRGFYSHYIKGVR